VDLVLLRCQISVTHNRSSHLTSREILSELVSIIKIVIPLYHVHVLTSWIHLVSHIYARFVFWIIVHDTFLLRLIDGRIAS